MKRSISFELYFCDSKLGAAYTSRPRFPEERLAHIIEDSGVGTFYTTVDNKLSAQDDRVVFVDSIDTRIH